MEILKKLKLTGAKKRLNRSTGGNIALFVFLGVVGIFMVLPLIYTVSNAFKPLDELFLFPPKILVKNPTMENFSTLSTLISGSRVPFSRYIVNTFIITVSGTVGHVVLASAAAYPLEKHQFRGKKFLFSMVVMSLMFSPVVTNIPNYLVISKLGINNTYLAIILPAFSSSLGLYLMKQFISQIPDSLIESARLDGANEIRIWASIVMPNVKPAQYTLILLMFQSLWGNDGGGFLRSEQLKPLNYALNQIVQGGIARAGASGAVGLILLSVPILFFVITQSNIIETMATSGMKD